MGGCEITTHFDQRGQHVHGPQTNIVGDVDTLNVAAVADQASLVAELDKLRSQLGQAAERGEIDRDLATDAEYRLAKAGNEAEKATPDRSRFLDHLGQARELLQTAAAGAGLVTALGKLAEVAEQLLT